MNTNFSGSFLDQFLELVQSEEAQERLMDASRQIFTSSNITVIGLEEIYLVGNMSSFHHIGSSNDNFFTQVNLLPALLLGGLLLLALPLLFAGRHCLLSTRQHCCLFLWKCDNEEIERQDANNYIDLCTA